ncbi:MAG: FMN-binding glutamate synthase family protein, partial [Planctomycetes bacterium]|nr:FMN-binding glutamate synthase family protein [Planctomycetota bacterium]
MFWTSDFMIGVYIVAGLLVLLALRDRIAGGTVIIRNFPIVGHLRYLLIEVGPELRQYLVANNREELPFTRSERQWIERSAEGANNYFGFGTDDMVYGTGYPIIKHAVFPYGEVSFADKSKDNKTFAIPSAKVIGEWHKRANPYRPKSIINISAMSFGALSGRAIESLNRGAKLADLYHNTGEGGCSRHHRHGADVCFQIGTGMFGCRDEQGRFSPERLVKLVNDVPQIRMIEVKLSQGAKPGKGGVLPGKKVTWEISEARGVPIGHDCVSPNAHVEFTNADELIDFVETVAQLTQRPVGIKSAVGQIEFWEELADKMAKDPTRGPDFITIDGGEGGTGAAPLTFADHVSLPFKTAFPRVYKIFHDRGIAKDIVWIASAKLGFPDRAMVAFAMGVDLLHIAREAMISIGCIQAQKCHTNLCPTGVATQNTWLAKGVDPEIASKRLARYVDSFRKELLAVTHACGYQHPCQIKASDIELCSGPNSFSPLAQYLGYEPVKPRSPYEQGEKMATQMVELVSKKG